MSFVLGDYVQDADYREHIVHQLLFICLDPSSELPDPTCILWTYSRTVDGSPLRRLLRDVCVAGWDTSENMSKYKLNEYPHDFLADVTSQTLSLLRNASTMPLLKIADYLK